MFERRTFRTTALTGLFLLTLVGPLIASQPTARANTYTVTTFADVVNVFDGVTSLREAVLNSNIHAGADTIVLAPGTYNLTSCVGPLSHVDSAALTVEGHGATIAQTCLDTAVIESTDDASALTLTDLGIIGGPNSGAFVFGPGVYGEGAVNLDTVTITGVDGGPSGAGAAVTGSNNMPGAPVSIVDSTITGNDTSGVNGSNISIVVTRSVVTDNGGSGVNLTDGTPATITDSDLSRNGEYGLRTTGQGHTRVTVTGSTLNDNASTGLVCNACASLDLNSSTVNGNGEGGIDFSYDLDPVGMDRHLTVANSHVNNNTNAGPGGGISVTTIQPAPSNDVSPILTVQNSTIARNATTGNGQPGGGVYSRVGKLYVDNSTISRNVAGGTSGSSGGGIYYVPDTDDLSSAQHGATIIYSTIAKNAASAHGGGAYLDSDGAVQVIQTRVTKNQTALRGRGGGLWLREATPLLVEDSTVSANLAARGGGIYVAGRNGIYWAVIADTTINGNRASEYGGGVLVAELALVTFLNSTVSANRAEVAGGGIQAGTAVAPASPVQGVTLNFATLRANRAPQGGNLGARSGVINVRTSVLVAAVGPGCTFAPAATLAAGGRTFTNAASCAGHPTDVVSAADPQLGALADNGGFTRTHLPANTSPLVGMVPLVDCTQTLDQRGQPRPQGAACEPGSVEITGKRRS